MAEKYIYYHHYPKGMNANEVQTMRKQKMSDEQIEKALKMLTANQWKEVFGYLSAFGYCDSVTEWFEAIIPKYGLRDNVALAISVYYASDNKEIIKSLRATYPEQFEEVQ